MSRSIPPGQYPLILAKDRYGGTYSNGEWLAIREADEVIAGMPRAAWVLEFGPGDSDTKAGAFWAEPPDWIAVGATPDQAIDALLARCQARSVVT